MTKIQLDQAEALLARGLADQAIAITGPAAHGLTNLAAVNLHVAALKALGRAEEALQWNRRAVARHPGNRIAWHNLAATLGDLGAGAESQQAVEQAFELGLDASETWLVYARALLATGQAEAAEGAFRETLRRAPGSLPAVLELAELRWTARADLDGALAALDEARRTGVSPTALVLKAAGLLRAAGQPDAADARLADRLRERPDDVAASLALSDALMKRGEAGQALDLLRIPLSGHPTHPSVLAQVSWAQSALGRGGEAVATARAGLALNPLSQVLLSAEATAARIAGDPIYRRLYDYEAFVQAFEIATPRGWPSLAAYLADLLEAIAGLHRNQAHPSDQSLHGGSQTTFRLDGHPDPAIKAFFKAVDKPLLEYMARLGPGGDPLRRRNTGAYRISGAWSVRLGVGDFHRDHLHSEGWLSSAFYVQTPRGGPAMGREGWLRFGQPPFPTKASLSAEHYVRAEPGKLILFPSYMWHGTEPFTTDERRTTIAFDVVPA
jgi:tetratricopeptide (TPR) repeat protein